ncbi:hypothetical protein EDB89DRAFT_651325 [Lactarius sanguifluus]|nr:hypothetical protein EDB89DRAFT_651325 [Lactarius sanguifluus]
MANRMVFIRAIVVLFLVICALATPLELPRFGCIKFNIGINIVPQSQYMDEAPGLVTCDVARTNRVADSLLDCFLASFVQLMGETTESQSGSIRMF